jgi:hypothetical protein
MAKRALWQDRFSKFRESKQTVVQFCEATGCSVANFYCWKKKIDASSNPGGVTQPGTKRRQRSFVPVLVSRPSSVSVSVELPSGSIVRIPCDADNALRVVLDHVAPRVA